VSWGEHGRKKGAHDHEGKRRDPRPEQAEQGSDDETQEGRAMSGSRVDEGGEHQPQKATAPGGELHEELKLPLLPGADVGDDGLGEPVVGEPNLLHAAVLWLRGHCSRVPAADGAKASRLVSSSAR